MIQYFYFEKYIVKMETYPVARSVMLLFISVGSLVRMFTDLKEVLFLHMRKLKFIDIMMLIMCSLNVALQGNRLYFITDRDLKSKDFNIQTGCLTYTGNWKSLHFRSSIPFSTEKVSRRDTGRLFDVGGKEYETRLWKSPFNSLCIDSLDYRHIVGHCILGGLFEATQNSA